MRRGFPGLRVKAVACFCPATERPHELLAIRDSGVVVVVMAPPWQNARRHQQAASLIWHWPELATLLEAAKNGDCFRVPFTFGKSKVEQVQVNYEKVPKRFRKSD